MKTQGKDRDVVFLSGVRTPFGTFGGTLKDHSAIDLAAAWAVAGVDPKYMGLGPVPAIRKRSGGRYGIGSACIGGGQGAAVMVEAFKQ